MISSYTSKHTAILCPSLTVTDGEVTYSEHNLTVHTIATYACHPGYSLTGSPNQQCMENDQGGLVGVWSGTTPTCEGISMSM